MKKITFFFLLVSVLSCRKESTTWNTDLVLPLAHGTLNLSNILPDSLFYADDNGLYHLTFEQSLTDLNIDSLVNLEDTIFNQSFEVPFSSGTITLPAGTTIISLNEEIEIGNDEVLLREVKMKSGYLKYKVKSYIDGYMTCDYELPGALLNGESVSITANTPPGNADSPGVVEGQIDLSGYHIDLTGQNGTAYNEIFSIINVAVSATAPSSALVHGQDSVVVSLQFENPKIEYAKGYFGTHTYELNESVDIFGDAQVPTGLLFLDAASMDLYFKNNIGVDATVNFNTLQSSNSINSSDLNYAPFNNSVNLTRALEVNGEIFPFEAEYSINETNSDILSFIGILPSHINVNALVHINPLGNISGANDFYYTDFPLEAKLKMDIPLKIGAQALTLNDTIDLDFDENVALNGFLRIRVSNFFPFSANLFITTIHAESEETLLILDGGRIDQGVEDIVLGTVVYPSQSEILVPINASVLEALRNSNRMNIRVEFNTPDNPDTFEIKSDYKMDFEVLVDAAAEIELK